MAVKEASMSTVCVVTPSVISHYMVTYWTKMNKKKQLQLLIHGRHWLTCEKDQSHYPTESAYIWLMYGSDL